LTQEFVLLLVHKGARLPLLFPTNNHQTAVMCASNVHVILLLESCSAWGLCAYCLFQNRRDIDLKLNLKLDCCIQYGWLHGT